MKHRFYNKTKKEQKRILIRIALLALLLLSLFVLIAITTGLYFIAVLMFVIILTVIAPFFDMPSLKESGKMIYYSSLFITEKPKNGVIKIHGGTLFDYFFVIDKTWNGKQRTKFIIHQYLSGLLALIEEYEQQKDMKISGTSYIINQRTAEKIGFSVVKTDYLQKGILIYNFFNVLFSNSIAKNKLSFPKVGETKTFETTIGQLMEKKAYIERLKASLNKTIPH